MRIVFLVSFLLSDSGSGSGSPRSRAERDCASDILLRRQVWADWESGLDRRRDVGSYILLYAGRFGRMWKAIGSEGDLM